MHAQVGQADDGIGNKILINRYDSAIAEKEEDAAYEVDMRTPKIPVVINEYTRNLYGSPRGYKIQLNRPLLNLEPSGYARSKALGECRVPWVESDAGITGIIRGCGYAFCCCRMFQSVGLCKCQQALLWMAAAISTLLLVMSTASIKCFVLGGIQTSHPRYRRLRARQCRVVCAMLF